MSVQPERTARARKIQFYRPVLRAAHFAPRYWSTWFGLLILLALSVLPLRVTRAIGAASGLLMMALNRKRRHIASVNLRLCFSDLSDTERRRLLRRHFIVHGQSIIDIAHLVWSSPRRLRRMARWRGIESYRSLAASGQRIILLVPHFAGVNFAGALLAGEYPTFALVKPLRNEVLDWFVHRARTRFGAVLLARQQGLRPVVRAIEGGYKFFYLPDEDLGPKHSVFAPFFGVATATLPMLGRIAGLCAAVVVPCFVALAPWGYEIILQPPLEDFPTGSEVADAARMNRVIEDGVRQMPEQYFWTFKLFKTRPAGEPPSYD